MNSMKKYKNEITNIAGLAATVAGIMIAMPVIGTALVVAKVVAAVSVGIIGYFTGKKTE